VSGKDARWHVISLRSHEWVQQGSSLDCILFNSALEKVNTLKYPDKGLLYVQLCACACDTDMRYLRKTKKSFITLTTIAYTMGLKVNKVKVQEIKCQQWLNHK